MEVNTMLYTVHNGVIYRVGQKGCPINHICFGSVLLAQRTNITS